MRFKSLLLYHLLELSYTVVILYRLSGIQGMRNNILIAPRDQIDINLIHNFV